MSLTTIPTDKDKRLGDIAAAIRTLDVVGGHAQALAQFKRKMFLAYIEQGFTEEQALFLIAKGTP